MSTPLLRNLYFKWTSSRRANAYHSVPLIEDEKTSLESSDAGDHEIFEKRRGCRRPSFLGIAVLVLFIVLFIVTGLYINLRIQLAPKPSLETLECGKTLAEAKMKGCTFDPLAKVWLPPSCPRFGVDEYLSLGSTAANSSTGQWRYWHDQEQKHEMSAIELGEMAALPPEAEGNQWWSTGSEHMVHCTWMLLRMAHVVMEGERMDGFVSNFHHTKHCALFMLDRALESPGAYEIRTVGNVGFGWC